MNPTIISGIKVYYFKNISNMLAWKRFHTPIFLLLTCKKEIKNFDIIHIHGTRSILHIIAYHYIKKYKIPYILQAHGSVLPFYQKQKLKLLYDKIWGHKLLKNASKVIAVTKMEAEQYKRMGVDENKIEIIPNGIDLSKYEDLPKRGEFRRKYKIGDDEKLILYLGRLHKSKGIDLLINSFADLITEVDNVKLIIAGPDDGYRSVLEKLIQSLKVDRKVLFTGFISNDEKKMAFVDADVFVNPRDDEIFGLVFLEANACGTPVICSTGCGIADIIDGKTGFAVSNDKSQLRDALFMILNNEELRRRFGEGGRRLVRQEYNWDTIVRKLVQIYEKCL